MGNEIAGDGGMSELLNKYFLTVQSELGHPNQFANCSFLEIEVNGKCILKD